MKVSVLRAKYKIEGIVSNEGYIVIEERDDGTKKIEGVFGLDYAILNFSSDKSFDLILYEQIFTINEKNYHSSLKTSIFQSQTLYDSELYCPENYYLFSETDTMFLSITELVKDKEKIDYVCNRLPMLRQ